MADYILSWCEKCQQTTWQTRTDYEGVTCASGRHAIAPAPKQCHGCLVDSVPHTCGYVPGAIPQRWRRP